MKRIRVTISHNQSDPSDDLRVAARVKQDLWTHAPIEIDPDSSVHGTHRDSARNAYFDFATNYPDEVDRVIREHGHSARARAEVIPDRTGFECINCGNVSDQPFTECPNCRFRDIMPCAYCNQEIARSAYLPDVGDLFKCPMCHHRVRLSFHDPIFNANGEYNQPLVIVESAEASVHGV